MNFKLWRMELDILIHIEFGISIDDLATDENFKFDYNVGLTPADVIDIISNRWWNTDM